MQFLIPGFKNRFLKEKFSVGLDIGTTQIKTVKLKFTNDAAELCGYTSEPFRVDLGAVLKEIAAAQDIKKVNISVSGPAAIIRHVNFPRMSEGELRGALKFEAEKHIPFPIAEVNIDGYILKPDLPDNKMLVLLAAVKKDFIHQRLKAIEDSGLKVNAVDMDSLALINAFNFNYPDNDKTKAIALLNIGASFSNLNILEAGLPRLSRDIPIAGNNFTQKIADNLVLDFKSAESLKLKPDKESFQKIISAVDMALSQLATEIRTSFDYYESQSASTVAKIFLSGGASVFGGLKDSLSNLLGIEVDYWDPLKRITLSDRTDVAKIKAASTQLATAIGLALRP